MRPEPLLAVDSPMALAVAVVVAVALGMVAVAALRRSAVGNRVKTVILSCRIAALLIILSSLTGLRVSWVSRSEDVPTVKVFLDASLSIHEGMGESPGAVAEEYRILVARLDSLRERANGKAILEVYTFGKSLRAVERGQLIPEPRDSTTSFAQLAGPLSTASSGSFLGAAVVVTDGRPTDGGDGPKRVLAASGIPVHVVGTGPAGSAPDLFVRDFAAPLTGAEGDTVTARAWLSGQDVGAVTVTVTTRNGGEILERRAVQVAGGEEVLMETPVILRVGANRLSVELGTAVGERNTGNNRRTVEVAAAPARQEVILLTGAPNPNTPFLLRTLRAERRFRVRHVVRLEDRWATALDQAIPRAPKVIIIDNVTADDLQDAQRDVVESSLGEGSSLFWVAGDRPIGNLDWLFDPCGVISQGTAEHRTSATMEFTDAALTHPIFAVEGFAAQASAAPTSYPPLSIGQRFSAKEGAIVLAEDGSLDGTPLLIASEGGPARGRSLVWTSPLLWRLHLGTLENDLAGFTEGWLKRALYWLADGEGDGIRVALERENLMIGEGTGIVVAVGGGRGGKRRADRVVAHIVRGGEPVDEMELDYNGETNQWEGQVPPAQAGDYVMEVVASLEGRTAAKTRASFRVVPELAELREMSQDVSALQRLGEESGGSYHSWGERFQMLEEVKWDSRRREERRRVRIGNWAPVAGIIVLLLAAEWIARKRYGLL